MNEFDRRGCAISGAGESALAAYERSLTALLGWRSDAGAHVAEALREAPGFVMAHVLSAYQLTSSRDPRRVCAARPILERAAALPANERELAHLAAIAAVLDDDYEDARARLGDLLRRHPRDVLALHAAQGLDHIIGDSVGMRERVAAVLPAWSSDLAGHHAVLAMHAFALEECGKFESAERAARAALELNPFDARAHHAMAHVFEMSGRPADGIRWLEQHRRYWAVDTVVATHCRWHLALFHLTLGRTDRALALYDECVRAAHVADIADLIDGVALLWRIELNGGETGARWTLLADAWAPHTDDCFCSFNDLHAMLAFVGAGDEERAQRLEAALERDEGQPTRHGRTTHWLGLPACRAMRAFGHGDDRRAIALLAALPPGAHRFGGSHAQRNLLQLTLRRAIERVRPFAQRLLAACQRVARVTTPRAMHWVGGAAGAGATRP